MSPLDLPKTHSDTERLDFLLRFMSVDDVGDDCAVPGIVVNSEEMEETVSAAPPDEHGRRFYLCEFGDDLRTVIDRAIEAHNDKHEGRPRRIVDGVVGHKEGITS